MNVEVTSPETAPDTTPGTTPVAGKRWGFWATVGFSVAIFIVHTFTQGFTIGVMAAIQTKGNLGADKEAFIQSITQNGFYLAVATIVAAWVGGMVIVAFILARKNITVKEYLCLQSAPLKVFGKWIGFCLIFIFGWEALNVIFEQPGSEWMAETYRTAEYLPLLWVAIVVAAPVLEEMFFRGFLFEGLRDSRMGPIGAVLVTAIAWAAIHLQYNLFNMVMIGLLGVLLGIAKIKTRSLYVTISLHALINTIAMVQVTVAHNV